MSTSAIESHRSVLTRMLRELRTIVAGNSFSKLCLVFVELFLARYLAANEFGLFSITLAFLVLVANLALFGFNLTIIQKLAILAASETSRRLGIIQTSLLLVAAFGVAAGGLVALGAGPIASALFSKPELAAPLMVAGLIIPFETLNQAISATFRGLRLFRYYVLVLDLARNVVLALAIPLVVLFDLSATDIFWAFLIGSAAGSLIGLAKLHDAIGLFHARAVTRVLAVELLSFAYMLWLWNALQRASNRTLVVLCGIFLPASDVAVLAIAMRFADLMAFPQTSVAVTAQGEFARLFHSGNLAGLKRVFQTLCIGLVGFGTVLALPFLVDPSFILGFFGPEYAASAWILWPLTFASLVNMAVGPVGQLLISTNHRRALLVSTIIGAAVQFALVIPLMWQFGLIGAVAGKSARRNRVRRVPARVRLPAARHPYYGCGVPPDAASGGGERTRRHLCHPYRERGARLCARPRCRGAAVRGVVSGL